jgi:hypothetical protein
MQIAGRDVPKVNEMTNKALLWVATAIGGLLLTGSLSLIGLGMTKYADTKYIPRRDAIDAQLTLVDFFIEEKEAIFVQVTDLDPLTARRIGHDKGRWENYKAALLRQRADL